MFCLRVDVARGLLLALVLCSIVAEGGRVKLVNDAHAAPSEEKRQVMARLKSVGGGVLAAETDIRSAYYDESSEDEEETFEIHNPLEAIGMEHMKRAPSHILKDKGEVVLSASPLLLNTSGEWTTVTWSGVSVPNNTDWLGFIPANGTFNGNAPIKYFWANQSATYMEYGNGSFSVQMLNHRTDLKLIFCTNGTYYPLFVAESNDTIAFANYNEPLQGHLSLGADPSTVLITWVTRDVGRPTVTWIEASISSVSSSKLEVSANTTTYYPGDLCGSPANSTGYLFPGSIHTAAMTGLKPSTLYTFTYGDDKWGTVTSNFTSPPLPSPAESIKFFAFGDMGQGQIDDSNEVYWTVNSQENSLNTTARLIENLDDADFVLHIGDISYARGYVAQWDNFFHQVFPIASQVPYMTCIGNHERDFPDSGSYFITRDSGGECGVPYLQRMRMPLPYPSLAWYSFSYGPVHFVLMSTEHIFTRNSTQYKWLEAELASIDRSVTPWVVFSGHRPMYIDSTGFGSVGSDLNVAVELLIAIEPLLIEHEVDVAFWAHHHSYQRTCPVKELVCQPDNEDGSSTAPVHVVIGMAGAGSSTNIHPNAPEFDRYVNDVNHGYTHVSVNQTHFELDFHSGATDEILDSFTLYKPAA